MQNTSRLVPAPIRRALRSRLRSELGATLVETALSISLLLAFIIGIMEGSLALYSYHFISNAAREGVRYAIVRGGTWGTACATFASAGCTATSTNVQNYVRSLAFPGINSANLLVTTTWLSTIDGTANNAFNTPSNVVQVQVTYQFPFRVPFVPQAQWNMSSQSEMEISQ